MSDIFYNMLISIKKVAGILIKKKKPEIDFNNEEASNEIKKAINCGKPLMVARIGFVEINCMSGYTGSLLGIKKYFYYLKDDLRSYNINKHILKTANVNAGIFPPKKEIIQNFSKLMLEDIKQVDFLGRLSGIEDFFIQDLKNIKKINARGIEPYYVDEPWTEALKNKKVLVIHPFVESIRKQYKNREKLFENQNILPEFSLKTIKSVQSAAGQKDMKFKDWFEALNHMKNQINEEDFDIAIIGCGAYGFPLAAHIKRMGKQAIHMGGATQILFGIKGKRWENHSVISKMFNEYWIRPSKKEVPPQKNMVEGGCYW